MNTIENTIKYKNIIFLDIDGVLNCEEFYVEQEQLKIATNDTAGDYRQAIVEDICPKRVKLISDLCNETDSVVVISSAWRGSMEVEDFQQLFDSKGGSFKVIGLTDYCKCRTRGCEIKKWLKDHILEYNGKYAIIDDDMDMLITQQNNFFHIDNCYYGLTKEITSNIKKFFNK